MPFTPKAWKDAPLRATPISAAALIDMEQRLAAYSDSQTAEGVPGPEGPAGAAGLGFTYRGTWSGESAYERYDVVTHEGAALVALTDRAADEDEEPITEPGEGSVGGFPTTAVGREAPWHSDVPDGSTLNRFHMDVAEAGTLGVDVLATFSGNHYLILLNPAGTEIANNGGGLVGIAPVAVTPGRYYLSHQSYVYSPAIADLALTGTAPIVPGTPWAVMVPATEDGGGGGGAEPIAVVTTLPATPGDGDEVYFLTPASGDTQPFDAGVLWHLRYRAGSPSTYKWDCLGGGSLAWNGGAGVNFSVANAWTQADPAAQLTLPLPGDYEVSVQAQGQSTVAGVIALGLGYAGTMAPGAVVAATGQTLDYMSLALHCAVRWTDPTHPLGMWFQAPSTNSNVGGLAMTARPIRVGPA